MAETKTKPEQPKTMKKKHLAFLCELRESGMVNMFGARPYLMDEFPELSKQEAAAILSYWMKTFGGER